MKTKTVGTYDSYIMWTATTIWLLTLHDLIQKGKKENTNTTLQAIKGSKYSLEQYLELSVMLSAVAKINYKMFHKFTTTVNWLFMAINTNDKISLLK